MLDNAARAGVFPSNYVQKQHDNPRRRQVEEDQDDEDDGDDNDGDQQAQEEEDYEVVDEERDEYLARFAQSSQKKPQSSGVSHVQQLRRSLADAERASEKATEARRKVCVGTCLLVRRFSTTDSVESSRRRNV